VFVSVLAPLSFGKTHEPTSRLSGTCSSQVMHTCWVRDPDERPSFEELKAQLEELWMELRQDDMKRQNQGMRLTLMSNDGKRTAESGQWTSNRCAHSVCANAGFLSKLRSKPK